MAKKNKQSQKPKSAKKNRDVKVRNRYDPWRVEGDRSSRWESLLLMTVLCVMFLGAYGLGWCLGGALRQKISQNDTSLAQIEPKEETSEAELDIDADSGEKNQQAENEAEPIKDDNTNSETEEVAPIPAPNITGKKLIALTFDDGPSGAVTEQLLGYLREKQVRATFFVIGYMAERTPSQVQKEASEGHEIGSHTTNHTAFSRMSAADLVNDSLRMNQLFVTILGHNTPFVRPPYGDGAYTEKARTSAGQPMILWTVDTLDWKYRDTQTVRQNAVKDAFDGAIILFHDVYQTTADAIPLIIDDLRAQGYEFLTVSELAKARGVTMQNGVVYGSFTLRLPPLSQCTHTCKLKAINSTSKIRAIITKFILATHENVLMTD